jgi:hypothetical protein
LERLRQEGHEFETSLGYVASPYLIERERERERDWPYLYPHMGVPQD